jgi:beta-glucanase (GH16 family)
MESRINEKIMAFSTMVLFFMAISLSAYSQEKLKLVWEDHFHNYKGGSDSIALPPNPDHWAYEVWKPGVVNQELQSYTADLKNSRVQHGLLVVEAHKKGDSITSARINTNKSPIAKRQTGRIEFSAKIPAGLGTWPGLWLMPTDIFKYATTCSQELGWTSNCDAWPNSGEIDAMEHVGKDPNNIHFSVHTKNANFTTGNHFTQSKKIPTATTEFHTYAVELYNNRIDFYIDNMLQGSLAKPATSDWKDWPFDQPFYAIVNLAIGGSWGGPEVDDSMFPVKLEVDYIKMYEFVKN